MKSVAYGSTDLLKEPLKLGDPSIELKVTFAVDPAVPFGSLKGRVIGLDAERAAARLNLNGVTAFANFETAINRDGSFDFAKIPQGTYVPVILGAGISGLLSPSTIVVTGTELTGIEITVPKQSARKSRSPVEETPTGATVLNLNSSSREAANESAAVANLRTINTAMITYLSASGGKYGSIQDLIRDGLLGSGFNGTLSGFTYSIITTGKGYAAAAIPASQGTGRYGYYSTPDGVIRYSTLDMLAPPRESGNPVR